MSDELPEAQVEFIDTEHMEQVCGAATQCLQFLKMDDGQVGHNVRVHIVAVPAHSPDNGTCPHPQTRDFIIDLEGAAYLAAEIVRAGRQSGEEDFTEDFEHFLSCPKEECWMHGDQYQEAEHGHEEEGHAHDEGEGPAGLGPVG